MENKPYAQAKGRQPVNVGTAERIVSLLGGSLLMYKSLQHKNTVAGVIPGALLILRGATGYCPLYDMMGKQELKNHNINIRTRLVVNKPVSEVYRFWRNLENLPLFMKHLKSVEVVDEKHSHWKAKIEGMPGAVSWDAVIVNEKPDSVLGWKSLEGAAVDHAGKVEFTSLGTEKCELHIVFSYRAPLGAVGENIARLFSPTVKKTIIDDIHRFREFIETESGASAASTLI
ncbi:MAG: DUF2892 domain-containing protein [Flavobacterium sp.]|nr:MAG: DUF2892 domain-containing protein [Flavobacterium sp.]